jgi:hypothetical protein
VAADVITADFAGAAVTDVVDVVAAGRLIRDVQIKTGTRDAHGIRTCIAVIVRAGGVVRHCVVHADVVVAEIGRTFITVIGAGAGICTITLSRAGFGSTVTVLGDIALSGRRAAGNSIRLNRIGWAINARSVAVVGYVTDSISSTTLMRVVVVLIRGTLACDCGSAGIGSITCTGRAAALVARARQCTIAVTARIRITVRQPQITLFQASLNTVITGRIRVVIGPVSR